MKPPKGGWQVFIARNPSRKRLGYRNFPTGRTAF